VVGNGTSGGLGVGGAIWGGGKVHVGSAGYADGGAKLNVYATPSDAGYLYGIRLSDNSTATLALGLQTPTGTTSSFIHSNIALGFGTVGVAALNINTSQQVQVLATTASSSTTTGALVVSGGVGVAGAINAGGILKTTVADAAYNARFFGATGGMRVRGYTDATYGTVVDSLNTAESAYQPLTIASSTLRLNDLTNGAIVTGTGTFTISGTTASTSTSSGALVVSGGVGVAGTLCVGGGIAAYNDSVFLSPTTFVARSDGTNASLYLRANGTGKVIIDLGSGGLDVSAGPIRTAAPSGGTAANWKLGTVATVSPTSPNRTIEVDIGGTIYYIHAKTTNN
jgi:lipopolysaccharide export system protein LptA